MKTLGQMLMDAFSRADTVETVALVGDRLVFTHRANANEQIEAAFTREFHEYAVERVHEDGFASDAAKIVAVVGVTSASEEQFLQDISIHLASMVLGISFINPAQEQQ